MALTPATLARHELCGLPARVAAASNRSLVGIEGTVVSETESTLHVAGAAGTKQVPKAGATFEFDLTGESSESADSGFVTVEGERLVANPARRTERTSDSKWR